MSLVAAMDERRGIGFRGQLPWHLPDELKHFKALTMGHHLIMGRKTFASVGRPLPGRKTIVVSRNLNYRPEGCLIASSLESALDMARNHAESEAFVIGGGEIFAQAIASAGRMYLTCVHALVEADTFFPDYAEEEWIEKQAVFHPADQTHAYSFTIRTLVRR